MLRDRGHRNRIGFFLHVPFPPPEILTALPNHEWLIPQLSAYDLVGLQTENDATNFARYLENECRLQKRGAFAYQTRGPDGAHRRLSHRHRDQRVQPPGAAFGALAAGARRARKPRRARHDDRRRSARLFQGPGAAHGRVRALPRGLSGLARQGHLPADHAEEPLGNPGIRRNGAHDQRGRRPHQRRLRRSRLDADPLRQSRLQPQRAGRPLPLRARRARHAACATA